MRRYISVCTQKDGYSFAGILRKEEIMKIFRKITDLFINCKLRTKMMLMYLFVLLPVFVGSFYLLGTIKNNISESEKQNSLKNSDSIEIRITDMVDSVENISSVICVNSEIPSFLNKRFENDSEIYGFYSENDIIDNYVSLFPQIKNIRIFINRDDFVYNSNYRFANDKIRSELWYQSVEGHNFPAWRVVKDPVDNETYLACVRRICDENGNMTAAAVIEINPEWLNEYFIDPSFGTVLSVDNGIVYFSTVESIKVGSVITSTGEYLRIPGINEVMDSGVNGTSALTILSTFTGSISSGSIFQILLVNPGNSFETKTREIASIYIYYIVAMFIVSVLFIIVFISAFSRRISVISEKMHSVALGNFAIESELRGNDEIAQLENDLCVMVDSMQLMMKDVYNSKLEAEQVKLTQRDAEFKALANQINPHFLYNTLETIRMKAYCNNDKETADLIKKLGKFMRRCLEVKNGNVTLKSEIDFTNSYLELQSARFGNKISYEIRSSVEDDYRILPLIIQPIVENAFVHGIESSVSDGRIDVHIYYVGEYVYIDVIDNGVGIPPEKMKQIDAKLTENNTSDGKSIGLTNVNKRIKMSFGNIYGISIQSREGEGTNVRVMLPRNPEKFRKESER